LTQWLVVRCNDAFGGRRKEESRVQIDPVQLGTLQVEETWVPYIDLYDVELVPAKVSVLDDEYSFAASFLVKGHGATMPQLLRELRGEGKRALIVEREDRYYVFATAA
jgi:hypothetical protein